MHYIRFLKPPRVLSNSPQTLSAKITITTDLGESFLWADVSLIVELEYGNGSCVGDGKEYIWKGRDGMRGLEVSIPTLSRKRGCSSSIVRMLVRPKEDRYSTDIFEAIVSEQNINQSEDVGGIVAVRSTDIYTKVSLDSQANTETGMAERVFSSGRKDIHIWEETGESIARHIWYSLIRTGTSFLTQPN